MQQLKDKKEHSVHNDVQQPTAKPEPIEKWENEGGQVIPTGSIPVVVIPESKEDKAGSKPKH